MAVYTIDPFDAQMPFPLDLRYRKADLNGRNSIPSNSRYPGMLCWTDNERVVWVLDVGSGGDPADNTNWKQLYPAAGGATQNVTWSANAPTTQGSNGDIWFRDNADTGNVDLYFKAGGSWGLLGSWSKEGAVPTLQEVTDEGNVTTNFIEANDIAIGRSGVDSGRGGSIRATNNEVRIYNWVSGSYTSGIILDDGRTLVFNRYLTGANPGGALAINQSGNASFVNGAENAFIPVSGADAVSDDDFVTKRQLDAVAATYTPDPSLPDPPTKSYLNTNYPSAKVGDVVYWEGTTQVVEAKCYAAGEWNYTTKNRCQ